MRPMSLGKAPNAGQPYNGAHPAVHRPVSTRSTPAAGGSARWKRWAPAMALLSLAACGGGGDDAASQVSTVPATDTAQAWVNPPASNGTTTTIPPAPTPGNSGPTPPLNPNGAEGTPPAQQMTLTWGHLIRSLLQDNDFWELRNSLLRQSDPASTKVGAGVIRFGLGGDLQVGYTIVEKGPQTPTVFVSQRYRSGPEGDPARFTLPATLKFGDRTYQAAAPMMLDSTATVALDQEVMRWTSTTDGNSAVVLAVRRDPDVAESFQLCFETPANDAGSGQRAAICGVYWKSTGRIAGFHIREGDGAPFLSTFGDDGRGDHPEDRAALPAADFAPLRTLAAAAADTGVTADDVIATLLYDRRLPQPGSLSGALAQMDSYFFEGAPRPQFFGPTAEQALFSQAGVQGGYGDGYLRFLPHAGEVGSRVVETQSFRINMTFSPVGGLIPSRRLEVTVKDPGEDKAGGTPTAVTGAEVLMADDAVQLRAGTRLADRETLMRWKGESGTVTMRVDGKRPGAMGQPARAALCWDVQWMDLNRTVCTSGEELTGFRLSTPGGARNTVYGQP